MFQKYPNLQYLKFASCSQSHGHSPQCHDPNYSNFYTLTKSQLVAQNGNSLRWQQPATTQLALYMPRIHNVIITSNQAVQSTHLDSSNLVAQDDRPQTSQLPRVALLTLRANGRCMLSNSLLVPFHSIANQHYFHANQFGA